MTEEHSLPPRTVNRREFLALGAMATLPPILAACGGTAHSSSAPAKSTPTNSGITQQASPTSPAAPTEADWQTLAASMQGTLVRRGNPQYTTAHQLFDPRFDTIRPAAIAYCAGESDVQACLSFARHFSLPFAPRSGGHSYAGYSTSTGLVIDVTRMHTITVNTGSQQATIGAGARLIDVYATLASYDLALPAGSCPTVGVAGLTLGGGVGVLSRKFGLTCDNLLAARVVVADGRVLTCDANHNADLFWALRGGGGGNFGVVTEFTFQAHPIYELAVFTLDWPWSKAINIVNAWQHWAPQAPDELWSNCLLLANKPGQLSARVNGVYVGNVPALNKLVQQLITGVGSEPANSYISGASLLNTMMAEAGCYGKTVAECHLPSQNPQGQLLRQAYCSRSDFFTTPLPSQGISLLVNAIARRQASATFGNGGILLDASGGAINRVPADATAFVHRDDLFLAQYVANWNSDDSAAVVEANHAWLAETWQAIRPYASGTAYQNYIDPDLVDWPQAYYGLNLPKLMSIKALYDPENLFRFKQSITP